MKSKNFQHLLGGVLLLLLSGMIAPAILMGVVSRPDVSPASIKNNDGIVDLEALSRKVLELNKAKKHQEAMNILLGALENNQEDELLRALLVQSFELFLDDEILLGQQKIFENKHDVSAYLRVAGALELIGNSFQAKETLINGISLNPKASELWLRIAHLEQKETRDNEALDIYKEVIRLNPKSSNAYNNAAYIITQNYSHDTKDLNLAEGYAEMAIKLEPRNPDYIDTLAEVKYRKGNTLKAKSLMEKAIQLAPGKESYKSRLKSFSSYSPLLFK
ncbi:MAG: hypothetical protein H6731_09810 [Myxococcales bacterium]|nr:MAG: hypothetical protein H6731_09810 [Myxococcales bacterium]